MHLKTAYLGLGSNLDDPIQQIRTARQHISALQGVFELAFSSLYQSIPLGPPDQPDYINAVMAIETSLPALDLLKQLQSIESLHGRVREGLRWGARTLDIDILLYGDEMFASELLNIPHIGLRSREFVLYPLAEIAHLALSIPGQGTLGELLNQCPRKGLKVIGHA